MENFLIEYGIWALAFFLFIDDLGFPFPTTTILFSSAILAKTNPEVPLLPLFCLAIILPPISNNILFHAGKHGLRKWLNSHGHKILLPKKRLLQAEKLFKTQGDKTVFFAAMITSIRPVSSVIAGSLNMNPFKFMIYHFLGVIIWASSVFLIGYFLGDQIWVLLKSYGELVGAFMIIGIITKIIIQQRS